MSMAINLVTMADTMRIGVLADESNIPDLDGVKELVSIYERINTENLKHILSKDI